MEKEIGRLKSTAEIDSKRAQEQITNIPIVEPTADGLFQRNEETLGCSNSREFMVDFLDENFDADLQLETNDGENMISTHSLCVTQRLSEDNFEHKEAGVAIKNEIDHSEFSPHGIGSHSDDEDSKAWFRIHDVCSLPNDAQTTRPDEECVHSNIFVDEINTTQSKRIDFNDLINTFECNYCKNNFDTENAMRAHWRFCAHRRQTGVPNSQYDYAIINEHGFYVCRTAGCDKKFPWKSHLIRHMAVHSRERPFHCIEPKCGKRFSRKYDLVAHVKNNSCRQSKKT